MPLYGIPESGTGTRPVAKLGYFNAFESLELLLKSEDVVGTLGKSFGNDSTRDGFVRPFA